MKLTRSPQGIEIQSLDDLGRFASMAVKSGLFKDLKDAAQAAVKIQAGLELGLAPLQSLSAIHLVEGKPTLGAGLLAALMQRAGFSWRIVTHTHEECTLEIHREGEALGEASFTAKEAEAAGLLRRPPWQRHRKDMLFARAISRAARWYAPAVALGVYTPDELGGEEEAPSSSPVDIAPAPIALPAPPPPPPPLMLLDAPKIEEPPTSSYAAVLREAAEEAQREAEEEAAPSFTLLEETAEATAAYDAAVQARKGDDTDPNWQRASARFHATLRDFFWDRDAVKAALRCESVKELPASVFDAASALLSSLDGYELRHRWDNLPTDVKRRADGVKDLVKDAISDTSRQVFTSAIIRAVQTQGVPHKLIPPSLREAPLSTLRAVDELLAAPKKSYLKTARAYLEKTASMGAGSAREEAQAALSATEDLHNWMLAVLEAQV
jgi:hypothetical protein